MTSSRADWLELTRLMREMSTDYAEPEAAHVDEPDAAAVAAAAETRAVEGWEVDLAMAECVAGNGLGPACRVSPRHCPRFDAEKALAQMSSALPVPSTTTKAPRRRPAWREYQN